MLLIQPNQEYNNPNVTESHQGKATCPFCRVSHVFVRTNITNITNKRRLSKTTNITNTHEYVRDSVFLKPSKSPSNRNMFVTFVVFTMFFAKRNKDGSILSDKKRYLLGLFLSAVMSSDDKSLEQGNSKRVWNRGGSSTAKSRALQVVHHC